MKHVNIKLVGLMTAISLLAIAPVSAANAAGKPLPVLEVASKKQVKANADLDEYEAKLNAAAKSLRGSKEFLEAVQAKDSRAISKMMSKEAGLDVPLSTKFKGDVDIQNLTIFIGCQRINGVLNCGIWLYN